MPPLIRASTAAPVGEVTLADSSAMESALQMLPETNTGSDVTALVVLPSERCAFSKLRGDDALPVKLNHLCDTLALPTAGSDKETRSRQCHPSPTLRSRRLPPRKRSLFRAPEYETRDCAG